MNHCDAPGLMTLENAIQTMLSQVVAIEKTERVQLMSAHRRVLAIAQKSNMNVPPADNSAMDGYALCVDDSTDTYTNIGTILAGNALSESLLPGQCMRIMTGGVLPKGANSVVMQENTMVEDVQITVITDIKKGDNIRRAGEDIQQDSIIIEKGTELTPSHLALLASVGIHEVPVVNKPKVALLATGDELTPPGQPLKKGAIYESNRYALHALLEDAGADILDLGIIKDDKDALKSAFKKADQTCDLIISSGGVSVGEADFVKEVLNELGDINFWKVAVKPGKPFAFGQLSHAWFAGLPGNPVSSYVTFEQLVMPVLSKLKGIQPIDNLRLNATASKDIFKRPGRQDFQRGVYRIDNHGHIQVEPSGKQNSGIMSSIANANCYIVLEQERGKVLKGESVTIEPF